MYKLSKYILLFQLSISKIKKVLISYLIIFKHTRITYLLKYFFQSKNHTFVKRLILFNKNYAQNKYNYNSCLV